MPFVVLLLGAPVFALTYAYMVFSNPSGVTIEVFSKFVELALLAIAVGAANLQIGALFGKPGR